MNWGRRKFASTRSIRESFETEGTHTAGLIGSDFERDIVSKTPLGRSGQPNDIATIAVFLASQDSAWLTGEQILASGGMR